MNKVDISSDGVPLPPWKKNAARYVKKILRRLGRDNWELSLLFCSNAVIRTLNERWRNINEATDVLSFPLGEGQGDIALSLDALRENAAFFNVDEDEELRRLLIHGILHIDGMDHSSNDTEEPMLVFQERLLAEEGNERIMDGGL